MHGSISGRWAERAIVGRAGRGARDLKTWKGTDPIRGLEPVKAHSARGCAPAAAAATTSCQRFYSWIDTHAAYNNKCQTDLWKPRIKKAEKQKTI